MLQLITNPPSRDSNHHMDPDSFINDTQKVQFSDPTQKAENQSQDDTLKLSLKNGDSVSPWLDRIKDPFQDPQITPARKAKTSIPHMTPSSVVQKRQRHSFDTPPTARAHKVFSKLRDHDAEQEELEYGTQKTFLVPQQTPDDEDEDPDDTFFKQPEFSMNDSPFKKPSNKASQSMIEVPQSVQRRRKMDVVQTQSPPAGSQNGSNGVAPDSPTDEASHDVTNGVVIDSDEDAHTQLIVPDSRSFDEVPPTTPYEDTLSLRHSRRVVRDKTDKADRTDKTDFIEESSPAVRGMLDYLPKRVPSSPYRKKEVLSQKSFSDIETPILKRRRIVESSDEPRMAKLSLESKSRSTTPDLSESVSEEGQELPEGDLKTEDNLNSKDNCNLKDDLKPNNSKANNSKPENDSQKMQLPTFPNKSVWLRNGSKIYPATVLESGSDTLEVSTGSELLTVPFKAIVSPLDIRVGDKVKTKSIKNTDSIVLQLDRSSEPAIQCIRGFDIVVLQSGNAVNRVPLSQVYMNNRHWRSREKVDFYNDKVLFQEYLDSLCHVNSKKYLPSSPSKVRVKYLPTRNLEKGVFYGCIFFITHSGKGKVRDRSHLASLILENGGMVYEEGYSEIIKVVTNSETPFLQPVSLLEKVNFGAVISNAFCRSPKYIQTLALGWPVLSDHFITDAIRNPERMLQWEAYLLPSGECTKLGTVKSCNVTRFTSNFDKGCTLKQQLKNNAHVLEKYALFVVGEFDSDILEFLLACLGIKCVVPVKDMSDFFRRVGSRLADKLLFYSDDGISRVNALLQEHWQLHKEQFRQIPSSPSESNGMKNFELEKVTGNSQPMGERWLEVDLVDKEWIIQCVIGGVDWDCEYTWKGAY